jgi:hypothetical protein
MELYWTKEREPDKGFYKDKNGKLICCCGSDRFHVHSVEWETFAECYECRLKLSVHSG